MNDTLVLLVILILTSPAMAEEHRSRAVTYEFQKEHPCPSTGKQYGACPGYVKDHIDPLCHGGADAVTNMQWQTTADAKLKDRWEKKLCRKTP